MTAENLSSLAPGDAAVIRSVDPEAEQADALLLHGFVPGTRVEMVRRAPFGDPLIVHLRGIEVALRADDAMAVEIE